jgi:hypothetical protein
MAGGRWRRLLIFVLVVYALPMVVGHCEDRSDEAIQPFLAEIASLRSQ